MNANPLHVRLPEVHQDAQIAIDLVRTLRIPDDGNTYPLPPGLGGFQMRSTDEFDDLPARFKPGVVIPMWQAEAMWISLRGGGGYPMAIQIAAGGINAVTGEPFERGLRGGDDQNYLAPDQPWLDGFVTEKGKVRQFVAMPLGSGFSVEEQVTGAASTGGLQLYVYPMRPDIYERDHKNKNIMTRGIMFASASASSGMTEMGLGEGGTMKQEIYQDSNDVGDYLEEPHEIFVNILHSADWFDLTGELPLTPPPTAQSYARAGMPWFDYLDDGKALAGSPILAKLKTINDILKERGGETLSGNETIEEALPVILLDAHRTNALIAQARVYGRTDET